MTTTCKTFGVVYSLSVKVKRYHLQDDVILNLARITRHLSGDTASSSYLTFFFFKQRLDLRITRIITLPFSSFIRLSGCNNSFSAFLELNKCRRKWVQLEWQLLQRRLKLKYTARIEKHWQREMQKGTCGTKRERERERERKQTMDTPSESKQNEELTWLTIKAKSKSKSKKRRSTKKHPKHSQNEMVAVLGTGTCTSPR